MQAQGKIILELVDQKAVTAQGQPQQPRLASALMEGWPNDTRCYAACLYNAEVSVASILAGMMGELEAARHLATADVVAVAGKGASQAVAVAGAVAGRGSSSGEEDEGGVALTEGQQAAVALAAWAPLMLLTGDAGCGKTHTTRAIVLQWLSQGKRVAMCAPTGERGG